MKFEVGDIVAVRSKGLGKINSLMTNAGSDGYEVVSNDGYRLFVPLVGQEKLLRPTVSVEHAESLVQILRTPDAVLSYSHTLGDSTVEMISKMLLTFEPRELALELRALYNRSPSLTASDKRKVFVIESVLVSELAQILNIDPVELENELKSYRDLSVALPTSGAQKPSLAKNLKSLFGLN